MNGVFESIDPLEKQVEQILVVAILKNFRGLLDLISFNNILFLLSNTVQIPLDWGFPSVSLLNILPNQNQNAPKTQEVLPLANRTGKLLKKALNSLTTLEEG